MERMIYWVDFKAQWLDGISVKPLWQKRRVVDVFEYRAVVNFTLLYATIKDAAEASINSDIQSQVLCTFNSRGTPLQVVACACNEVWQAN